MLVLTRKLNESILIGDAGLEITVLEIKGGRIRLGIKASPEVPVRRKELTEREVAEPASNNKADHATASPGRTSDSLPESAPTIPAVKPRRGTDFEMPVCEFAGI